MGRRGEKTPGACIKICCCVAGGGGCMRGDKNNIAILTCRDAPMHDQSQFLTPVFFEKKVRTALCTPRHLRSGRLGFFSRWTLKSGASGFFFFFSQRKYSQWSYETSERLIMQAAREMRGPKRPIKPSRGFLYWIQQFELVRVRRKCALRLTPTLV